MPALHIDGLITGSPYVELDRTNYIVSSSGYTAKIDYTGRGWLSGLKNSFTASLYETGKEKHPIYLADGQWSKCFSIKDAKTKSVIDQYDPAKTKVTTLTVAPVEEQDELESRRAWEKVAKAITKGDLETTSKEKTVLEESQRALRKKEKEENREWERRFFTRADKNPVFQSLAEKIGEAVESEKTNGIWIFDSEKAKEAKPPFKES